MGNHEALSWSEIWLFEFSEVWAVASKTRLWGSYPGSSKWRFAALRFVQSQDIREIRGPNAFKTRLKCTCHEIALSVTRQTCTWNCPGYARKCSAIWLTSFLLFLSFWWSISSFFCFFVCVYGCVLVLGVLGISLCFDWGLSMSNLCFCSLSLFTLALWYYQSVVFYSFEGFGAQRAPPHLTFLMVFLVLGLGVLQCLGSGKVAWRNTSLHLTLQTLLCLSWYFCIPITRRTQEGFLFVAYLLAVVLCLCFWLWCSLFSLVSLGCCRLFIFVVVAIAFGALWLLLKKVKIYCCCC